MQQSATGPEYFSTIPGVDPYVDWALGAGSASFMVQVEGRAWLPVLIETSGCAARDLALGVWERVLQLSALYSEPPAGLEAATHCTALVTREFFTMLLNDDNLKKQIARVAVGPPLRAEAPSEPASADSRS
jgi:hypothetical protein